MNKLCRSNAFQDEEASPEPPVDLPSDSASHIDSLSKSMSRLSATGRPGLPNQKSSSTDSTSPAMSRGSSTELYTDSSGINLQEFFTESLKQQKSRLFLLSVEKEMLQFVQDQNQELKSFGRVSSFHRMLIHRVAAFFGLEHNIDTRTEFIHVTKTPNTRIPDFKFESVPCPFKVPSFNPKNGIATTIANNSISDDLLEPKRLLRRKDLDEKSQSLDKYPDHRLNNNSNGQSDKNSRSKSYEERQVRYENARHRIFSSEMSTSSEGVEPGSLCNTTANSSGIDVSCVDHSGNPPITASSSLRSSQEDDLMRVSSVEKPWSSVESDSSSRLQRQTRTDRSLDIESQRRSHLLHPDYQFASTEGSAPYAPKGSFEPKLNRRGIPKASSFEGTRSTSEVASPSNYRITKTNSLNTQATQMSVSNGDIPQKRDSFESPEGTRGIDASSGGPPLLPKPNLVHQSSAPNTGSTRGPPPVRQSSWQNPRWQNQQTGHHHQQHHYYGGRPRYRGNFSNSHSSPSHRQYHPQGGMQHFPPPSAFMSPPINPMLPPPAVPGTFWAPSPDMMRPPSSLFYYQPSEYYKIFSALIKG